MTPRPLFILAETVARQALAADPDRSAWVSAHAGSGKTHVLAGRVVRLLLAGAEPSKILCLTYTKAAAGEMKTRIFRILGAWATAGDAELARGISAIEGRAPRKAELSRARQLFARALETPGGLKIQTIHAFCEAILKRFPLEANIAGHFELTDSGAESALLAEARRALLCGLDDPRRPALSAAFTRILDRVGESGLDQLLSAIVANRDGLKAFIAEIGGDGAWTAIFDEYGFAPGMDSAAMARAAWPLPGLGVDFIGEIIAQAEATGAGNVGKHFAPAMKAALAAGDPEKRLDLAKSALCTEKGMPRAQSDTFVAGKLEIRLPGLRVALQRAAESVLAAADRIATLAMVEDTVAALTLADALLERYERLKSGRGLLDFNDLIQRTLALLARDDAAQWVQYKLDKGIDHLLVDEAQDTSPAQWKIIAGVVAEFFAGVGARSDVNRTLFAVGDEKQSIYSFQGADPASFSLERDAYRRRAAEAGRPLEPVELRQSFRSTEEVLDFVDEVFRDAQAREGLTRDAAPLEHKSVRIGAPGSVELWPSLGAPEIEEPEDWRQAIDHAKAPAVQLAQAIARTVHGWIRDGAAIEGKAGVARAMRPRDIIVLVRKRDRFMHALARALKELENPAIAAAGADRLRLTDHIAVKDMIALGRVCLQPQDDLSLAAVLKSPVFGLDDLAVEMLAEGRGNATLLAAVKHNAAGDPVSSGIAERLARWRAEVDAKPPFEFFSAILGRDGVRRAMQARLGPEASEILDEFLGYALAFEKTGSSGLEAFLAALESSAPEIKREAAGSRDELRIMTVHAAKGLEAPVVFLVDSGGAPTHGGHLPTLMRFNSQGGNWRGEGFIWRSGKETQNTWRRQREDERRLAAAEEYRRLLYVGLTRAEDRLIVCGYHGKSEKEARWHDLASQAFDRLGARVETIRNPALDMEVRRFALSVAPDPLARQEDGEREAAPTALPDFLTRPLAAEPRPPRPFSPSGAVLLTETGDPPPTRSPVFSPVGEPAFAIRRGQAMHRMLQVLAGMDATRRASAADAWLARAAVDWPAGEAARARDAVLKTLSDPAFAPVFAPGSRAEVALQGVLRLGGQDRMIAGKIDRLVMGREILIVDFKTGRAPVSSADVSESHVAQLALYRALLSAIDPRTAIRAALLFVESPVFHEVPDARMDEALARLDAALAAP